MLKKAFWSGILLVFVFLASGCGTIYKGAQGVKEGARDDWRWAVKSTRDADAWVKKNLW